MEALGPHCKAPYLGEIGIVILLLADRAGVRVQSGYHGTALQAATVLEGNNAADDQDDGPDFEGPVPPKLCLEIVKGLLDSAADVNAVGRHHVTALQAAYHRGEEVLTVLLVEKGADTALGTETMEQIWWEYSTKEDVRTVDCSVEPFYSSSSMI